MIRAVIIEDEAGASRSLQAIIKEYLPDVSVVGMGQDVASGIATIKSSRPDLVFLDIRLPDGDGFEILDAMGSLDFEVIFTTAYGDYREKAFDYFSLHYLLKPIDVDRLEQAIARLKKRQHRSLDRMQLSMLRQVIESDLQLIALPEHNGYSLEAINDIVRCEAQGNYTAVYMKGGKKYLCARTMKHFDQTFQGHLFFRIHKSHLVNVRYVRQIQQGGEIVLEDNTRLPLSQRSRNLFLKFVQQTSNLSL